MTRSEPDTLSPVDKVLCLQNVDVFKHATTEMLAYISSIACEVRAVRNEVIFQEGDVSYAMYVVVKGRVRLDREGREVMTVGDCQSFGTWALFDNQPQLMTATAVEDLHCLQIRSEDFYDLLADHDEITPAIFKAVIERVKSLVTE
ncbi:MAG TPA: cyclic nucleotide-binding domain-containing protein [Terriglobia bacterium]|nr:cyclic nucleotide-binding domain-containing protein [Terriglobia bacterium]